MGENLVNLNVNPCKMCMPMGAVTAFSGIQGCMSILHGSQGCATYIRRHMATHYNEPVDIASSSLSEQGTVFGGEENLLKGLKNLIHLYHPEVIGVATTCLAETIGEDIHRIIDRFHSENPEEKVKIIRVASAGYSGTQYEGFFRALRGLVEQLAENARKGDYINVITSMISPADTRWLKSCLRDAGLDFILLPDLSESLDGEYSREYRRLKTTGTSAEDIARMGGARLTIEIADYISEEYSPAAYLEEAFGVPFLRISLPTGIESTDAFHAALRSAGGSIPDEFIRERGRYLDAMVDAHKFCAEARVAVFGEPDFVHAVIKLCCEIGAVPVVVATGSLCPDLITGLEDIVKEAAARLFVETVVLRDDADFDQIEAWCKETGANLLIGSSDGRRIAEKLSLPLIRCAFPIHDHIGGQRVRIMGFDGSHFLLEGIANAMIDHTHTTYRREIAEKYLADQVLSKASKIAPADRFIDTNEIARKTETHPCYSCSSCGTHARMHLPIAPKCNIQCNYCVRKFDCPNESRPGVTTEVLKPLEAFEKFKIVKAQFPNLSVVGIAGPGDALANFTETREALEMIRGYAPDMTFCLSTNGLMLPLYAEELIRLGVTHVTVTMNTIDPNIGAKIYHHVDYMGTRLEGVAGAAVLLANQMTGIRMLAEKGIVVKVNCVAMKGINDEHLYDVTKRAQELGAFITNIMPHISVIGSAFEGLQKLNNKELEKLRSACEVNIQQMRHCRQCRADAIGTLDEDLSIQFRASSGNPDKSDSEVLRRVAAASKSGMIVDLHFGQAEEFYIYESDGRSTSFIEKRRVDKYCTGAKECDEHDDKMERILKTIADCEVVLALRIGDAPRKRLERMGILPVTTYDMVESAVLAAVQKI